MDSLIKAYLTANAKGLEDGFSKAETHNLICIEYLSAKLGVTSDTAKSINIDDCFGGECKLVDAIRCESRKLTDFLDEKINFPLDKAPNYKRLIPKFKHEFLSIADDFLIEKSIYSDSEILFAIKSICKRKFDLSFYALESYGFIFVDGQGCRSKDRFLKMKTKIGQTVTITPKEYFGCNYDFNGISR